APTCRGLLRIVIEQHALGFPVFADNRLLKRMEHHRAGLVMRNADRGRGIAATVIRPTDQTGEQFLQPMKPSEADHCGCSCLWISNIDRCAREPTDLFASDGGPCCLGAPEAARTRAAPQMNF